MFAVSGVHKVVHLTFGAVGLMLTRSYAAARAYLLGGGLVYLALWAAGFFIDHSKANFGPVNVPTTGCTSGSVGSWCCWASPWPASATRPSDVARSALERR